MIDGYDQKTTFSSQLENHSTKIIQLGSSTGSIFHLVGNFRRNAILTEVYTNSLLITNDNDDYVLYEQKFMECRNANSVIKLSFEVYLNYLYYTTSLYFCSVFILKSKYEKICDF